jgi:A nuclease family of the HNH/ENDO VII superfamily with conserved AHH/Bacterial Ig domain
VSIGSTRDLSGDKWQPPKDGFVSNGFGRRVALTASFVVCAFFSSSLAIAQDQADPRDLAAKRDALSHGHLPPAAEAVVKEGIMRAYAEQGAPPAGTDNGDEFADLGRTDASQLFSAQHPGVVHGPGWADPDPLDAAASIEMLTPSAASVTAADGSTSVAVSSEPMAYETAGGALKQIDLDLHEIADGFKADASPVTTVLPDTATDSIVLGSDETALSIDPSGATVMGVRRDSGVFYANIANDVDLFVKPIFAGIETFHVLRSADSPEDVSFDVHGPSSDGSRLIAGADRTATVQIGDEKPWAIGAVSASDASGKDVPVSVSYVGDRMTIHVPHKNKDFTYPITVDPTFNMDAAGGVIENCWRAVSLHSGCQIDAWEGSASPTYNAMLWSPDGSNGGWKYSTSAGGRMANCACNAWLGNGLYIYTLVTGLSYAAWADAAYWTLTAPPETRITSAFFANLDTENWNDNASCSFVGIIENNNHWSPTGPLYVGNCAQTTYDAVTFSCEVANCDASQGGSYQNWAVFGADMRRSGTVQRFTHHMGAAIVYMHDDVGPRLSELARADNNSSPFRPDIEDWGLGLKSYDVTSVSNSAWGAHWKDTGCSGGVGRLVCPRAFTPSISLCGLTNGSNTINIDARDVSGNAPSNPYTAVVNVRVGLTAISGSLISAPNHTVTNSGQLTLHTAYRDPCGIKTLTAVIDGSSDLTPPQSGTAAGDTSTADWTIDASRLSPGQHTLTVNAQRNPFNGNAPELSHYNYTFYVASTSATYGGPNQQVDTPAEAEVVGQMLAGSGYQSVWAGLTVNDKNYMLTVADDPYFATWAPRIDTVAPNAPDGIQISDEDNTARTADIIWSEGSDPDVSSGVYGSAVDESNSSYRYKRPGGSWTSWTTSDSDGFVLTAVDAGASVDIEVREFDRAGNLSASAAKTLQVPGDAPVAHDAIFALPAIACIEWCPVAAAGIYAGGRYFWEVNQNHYDWSSAGSSGSISVTPSKEKSQSFEDAEAQAKSSSKRKAFRRGGEAAARASGESYAGKEAHHVVAAGAKAARYARWVFWKCGVDPNDFGANGTWLPKQYHRRMHTKDYYEAINRMLRRYDPTFGSDPCGQSQGGVDVDGQGLKRAMQDIINYVRRGEMP